MDAEIQLLGPPRVTVGGVPVDIGGARSDRVMAALALSPNTVVPIGRLVDVVWDRPPRSARQQVHTTVSRLRSRIPTGRGVEIVTAKSGYLCVVGADRVDLEVFRAGVQEARKLTALDRPEEAARTLERGSALWRGEPLSFLTGHYFESVALSLTEERIAATEMLLELRIAAGDGAMVVGELIQLVEEYPLRESLRATLMSALHQSGRSVDALAVYENWRRESAEAFGLDPGRKLQELHARILHGGPEPAVGAAPEFPAGAGGGPAGSAGAEDGFPDDGFTADAARPAKRYLPHDTRDFSGRRDELKKLVELAAAADPSQLLIVAVTGMGGVGKTAMAVRFAHSVAAGFGDGQYFVDLRGFSVASGPLGAAEALGILLRQSGVPGDAVPPDLDTRSALWRAQLAGRRALILLDNVVDVEQVRPLLPGDGGSLVVLTSRRRLVTLVGSSSVYLGPLAQEDATALFMRIAGAERLAQDVAGVREVVDLCGRLPLAIRIGAARFRERPSWTLPHLVRLLRSSGQRPSVLETDEAGVGAALALSHRHLSKEHARLFRLLSVHPGRTFDTYAAAAIADLDEDSALAGLEALFDDNLILQDRLGHYHFHDLVRECAAELCSEMDSEADAQRAHDRLVDFYTGCAMQWSRGLAQGPWAKVPESQAADGQTPPTTLGRARHLLSENGANLLATARSALRRSPPEQAWRMVCALQPYLRMRNYPDDSLELFEQAAARARSVADVQGEALCLMGMALVQRERFLVDPAVASLTAARKLSRRGHDWEAEMYQLIELGIVMIHGERFAEARSALRQAQEVGEVLGAGDEILATIHTHLGVVARATGHSAEGLEHLERALATHTALDAPLLQAFDHLTVGCLLLQDRRLAEAEDRLIAAWHLERGHQGSEGRITATALAWLAVSRRLRGDRRQALDHGRTALAMAWEDRMPDVACAALCAIGEACLDSGDLEGAETSFRQAARQAAEPVLRSAEARAEEGLAHLALRRGRFQEAEGRFKSALELYPPDAVGARNPCFHLLGDNADTAWCMRCSLD
ncbi:AfsR/SARP family transcriptional regulator [Catenulispora yoronensis]